jgi:hypothetical protein
MEPLDQREHKGLTIKVYQDEIGDSPRDWDNLGTVVCWHSRYNLGDKHSFDTPQDFLDYAKANKPLRIPIFMYDHSGIGLSTSNLQYPFNCPWDAGQVGWIYVEVAKVKDEWKWKQLTASRRTKILSLLEGEVETYDKFLRGEVYGYVVEDEEGNHLDSCGGHYELDYLWEEATSAADYILEKLSTHAAI